MAQGLQKQSIEIDFGDGGMDTKTQAKLVDSRHVIDAQNVRMNDKIISKRYGTAAIGANVTINAQKLVQTANAIGAITNSGYDGTTLQPTLLKQQLPTGSFGSTVPYIPSVKGTSSDVFRGGNRADYAPDSVTVQNPSDGHLHAVYVWSDSGASTWITVVDRTSGATVVVPTRIAVFTTTYGIKVCQANSSTVIIASHTTTGTQIVLSTYVAGTGFTASTGTLSSVGGEFDICLSAGVIVCAYYTSATNIKLNTITTGGVATATTANVTTVGATHISLAVDSGTTLIKLFWSESTQVRGVTFNSSLTVQTATWTVASGFGAGTISRLCSLNSQLAFAPLAIGAHMVFVEVSASATYNYSTRFYIGTDGSAATLQRTRLSLQIGSKPFMCGTDLMIVLWYVSSLQATYFLYEFSLLFSGGGFSQYQDLVPAVKLLSGVATATVTSSSVTTLASLDGTIKNFSCAVAKTNKLVSVNGTLQTVSGIAELKFSAPKTPVEWFGSAQSLAFNGSAKFSGGFLASFDGSYLTENGFLVYPEAPAVVQAGGGGLSDGTYQVAVVYELTDNSGNLVESYPSVITSCTVSGGGGTASLGITCPSLRVGIRSMALASQQCCIAIYVSDANLPNVLYQVTDPTAPTSNTNTSDTVFFGCTLSNAQLISRRTLYTTGGVLPNWTPDSPSLMFPCQNVVFIDDPNDATIMRYGKLQTASAELAFSDQFTVKIPSDGGRVKAGIELDTKAVFFKERSIYVSYGSGLTDTGQGQGFSQAQRTRSDVGCVGPNALCEIPQGVLFRSDKGIWLLGRDLNVTYVGADVEQYNSSAIRSWVHVKDQNEVRIALDDDSTVLVYNYEQLGPDGIGRWYKYTGYGQNSATLDPNGNYLFASNITGRALVYQETIGAFQDNHVSGSIPANITMQVKTPWYKFAQLGGLMRVWKWILSMSTQPVSTVAEVAYDFEEGVYNESHALAATAGATKWQPWLRFVRSRCQAVQLRITDSGAGDCQMSGQTFECGLLPGSARLPGGNNS